MTLTYAFTDRIRLGVEYNARAFETRDRFGPLANIRLLDETKNRPAVILGTSSDRIGTEEGQAYYATVSKNLAPWLDASVAPYVGVSWNDRNNDFLPLAGLSYRLYDTLSVTHLFDGRNLHHTFDLPLGNLSPKLVTFGLSANEDPFGHHRAGLIVVEQDGNFFIGLSYGLRF